MRYDRSLKTDQILLDTHREFKNTLLWVELAVEDCFDGHCCRRYWVLTAGRRRDATTTDISSLFI